MPGEGSGSSTTERSPGSRGREKAAAGDQRGRELLEEEYRTAVQACCVELLGDDQGCSLRGSRRDPRAGTAAPSRGRVVRDCPAMAREGPFWDVIEGRAVPPAAAVTLGWELIEVNPDAGTIEVAFSADDRFLNPVGLVQGGFLAAMLDDTLGPALVATLQPDQFAPTADLHVQFLAPARPGRLIGRGRIVRRGRDLAFLAGELMDVTGTVVATATATAAIRPFRQ
jgi:uncharacterized protein (TIGR00369 family)